MKKNLYQLLAIIFILNLGIKSSTAQSNITPCSASLLPPSGTVTTQNPVPSTKSTIYENCNGLKENNALWYKFTPKVDNFKIAIKAESCFSTNAKGVIATTFKQRSAACADLSQLLGACETVEDGFTNSITIPISGKTYWLKIDGTDASICTFTLTYNANELNFQTGTLKTQLFWDKNKNCTIETSEKDFPFKEAFLLVKQGSTIIQTLRPDSQGKVESELPFGNYDLEVRFLSTLWEACPLSTININQPNQLVDITIPIKELKNCSILEGDLSTISVEKNSTSRYRLNYKNTGTAAAINAVATISLDANQSIVTATKPFTLKNNFVAFDLNQVDALGEGYIELSIQNANVLSPERAVINKLKLFPSPLCDTPSDNWDKSNVEVFGFCQGGNAVFTIKNNGSEQFIGKQSIIIEDDVIGKTIRQTPNINSGDSILIDPIPTNGKTIRFELPPDPFNPFLSMPSATVEGCGNIATTKFGHANKYPQDDTRSSIDIDIRETEQKPKFNDILGFPKGYGSANYIIQNQDIEYLIRYKNNTDSTVQRLFIVDTLPAGLNITSLRVGNCSHPHEWSVSGNRTLNFALQNIAQNDSVYVKFKISQQKDLALGTVLQHRVAFYSEKEDTPLLSNTIFHTIGKNFITVKTIETFVPNIVVSVYPNPSTDVAHISIENMEIQTLNLEIFDLSAKLLLSQKSNNNRFDLKTDELPKGLYFFRISNDKQIMANGKLIIE